ncbi:arsenate reductase ArsC [Deinococcus cellulosilyticus]|uniref:Protein-tyrosine-phosphatase n=1 Tax=Deinococcus cellulosilyticus (strain DSM 18568 / NBRC 106333 / KACC 11606 / 5516J-15) TaxID=1223518 RepID=A0A511N013_DEIC1|nr:arsenate reductase ArsC [Deinococcus cellulosilyticus]GEM46184.1 protein-tyrosine-phosphatase [Deinococcus cellulosilyticus NBRC 106333 = KACC 11606]
MSGSNTTRTQLAEALLKHHAGDRFEVFSAGLEAGTIHPHTRSVLQELGVQMQGQTPKYLRDYLGITFNHLITLTDEGEDAPIFPGVSTRLDWNVAKPQQHASIEDQLNAFRVVRNQLDLMVHNFVMDYDLFKLGVKVEQ